MATKTVRHGSVLIVDDEPDTIESLRGALEQFLKLHVVTASTPKEALERLKEHPVHLILSDYQMPGMTGYELLNAAKKVYPGVHLMLMTGHPKLAEVDAKGPRLSAAFAKPLNPMRVIQAIRDQMATIE